ncbi:dTDP-4-dehydrorhamnose 3,5-epimerase [bacterium]|nr:dTDP-4-dehydrorhamnose 3,5-epimerase [bacterium]
MKIIETSLPSVLIIQSPVYSDNRGFFMETYHKDKFSEAGIAVEFVQDNHSRSVKGIVRGLHYQEPLPQGKLIRVTKGEIFDVAVDIRVGSPTFRKWIGIKLSADKAEQLWIPPGFAHGFQALSETADVLYKVTQVWCPDNDQAIHWRDEDIGVSWPIANGILSEKDAKAISLRQAAVLPRYPANP